MGALSRRKRAGSELGDAQLRGRRTVQLSAVHSGRAAPVFWGSRRRSLVWARELAPHVAPRAGRRTA